MKISGSQPSLGVLRLSLTPQAQRDALLNKLSEGQRIQAHVVDELSTGRWAIRFMGHTLVAESRLTLRPGQVVEARVHDLGPPLSLSISGRPGSEEAAVRKTLQQLSIKDDGKSRAIIGALIRNGLPVERSEVQAMRDFLAGLDNTPHLIDLDELVDRVLFLRSKGLPVTPNTIASFWSTVPVGNLGALIEGLTDLLKGFGRRAPESIRSGLETVIAELSRQTGDLSPDDIRHLLRRTGIDLEATLAQGKPADGLRATLLQLQMTANLTPDEQARIADLLRHLNTIQAASLPGDGHDPIVFQIPLLDAGDLTTADIRISRNADNKVDPSRVSVSVSVTLSVIGKVTVDLASYDGRNTCSFRVDNEDARQWLEPDLDSLRSSLRLSGYPVQDIQLRIDSDEQRNPNTTQPRIGVDFKA